MKGITSEVVSFTAEEELAKEAVPRQHSAPTMMDLVKKHFFWDDQDNEKAFGIGFVIGVVVLLTIVASAVM